MTWDYYYLYLILYYQIVYDFIFNEENKWDLDNLRQVDNVPVCFLPVEGKDQRIFLK